MGVNRVYAPGWRDLLVLWCGGSGLSSSCARDILGIVRVQAERLDVGYLRTYAPSIDVTDLLERALSAGGTGGR